jgi:hypothetical protein
MAGRVTVSHALPQEGSRLDGNRYRSAKVASENSGIRHLPQR